MDIIVTQNFNCHRNPLILERERDPQDDGSAGEDRDVVNWPVARKKSELKKGKRK